MQAPVTSAAIADDVAQGTTTLLIVIQLPHLLITIPQPLVPSFLVATIPETFHRFPPLVVTAFFPR